MDIQVSSNFERLLFDLYENDGAAIAKLMENFKQGAMQIDKHRLDKAQSLFSSQNADDAATCATIKQIYTQTGELLDPHTAIGVYAAMKKRKYMDIPMVTLATAHPAKFPDSSQKSGVPAAILPDFLKDLHLKQEKYQIVANDINAVKAIITA